MQATVLHRRPAVNLTHVSIGLLALTLFMGTAAKVVLSPLQELVRADLGLSDNEISLIQGLALAIPLALLSVPLGRLVDSTNRSRLLVVAALACAAGSALTAFAHGFAMMFAARMLVGASVAAAVTAAVSLASDLSDAGTRGRTLMLLGLGQACGAAATFALVGVLLGWLPGVLPAAAQGAGLTPWRLVQLSFAAVMALAGLALLALREPPRREEGTAVAGDVRAALRELWTYRRLMIPMVVGMTTIGMADAAASIWAVPVLTRVFHQQPADFGAWMSAVFLGSGIVGTAIGGYLADIGQRARGRSGILIGTIAGAALSIPAAFFPVMPSATAFAALFALLLTAGAITGIASTAAVAVLVPNELRGMSISLINAVALLMSYGVAPSVVSVSAGLFGTPDDIAVPLAVVGVVTSICGTLAFLLAMRVAERRPD
ncbi:MFS transporter [Pseudoduganella umbonata]|uniref:MFS family permease n=1 Tax=Pseudoduganella umbonata TaxID=864828 RepID=A0A4P8HNZ9_9BURK|nr:MFS transporter [Pseudoduganella umbonata]MBB3222681.1 MFS family permease [Pseudoduganella umbonata]QCP10816.1 MFS transporter [Pseudoduganella umbonata]